MSIAINPANPAELLVGANAIGSFPTVGYYRSSDSGLTWYGSDTLPTTVGTSGGFDPCVAFGPNGVCYFNYIDHRSQYPCRRTAVAKSFQDSTAWQSVAFVPDTGNLLKPDKPHMTIDTDTSSRFFGRVYTAFTDLFSPSPPDELPVRFAWSLNGDTFSIPTLISDHGYLSQGVNLAIGDSGTLYATWSVMDSASFGHENVIALVTSFDGGITFPGGPRDVLPIAGIRGWLKEAHSGSQMRVASWPSMAIDRSHGCHRGTIYIVWADSTLGNPDVWLSKSTNSGETWSSPIRVNDDVSCTDQWQPWIAVDSKGVLHIVFYDSRLDPAANFLTAVFMATSEDGGETFHNYVVSDVEFTPCAIFAEYAGDYIGIAADSEYAYPCWNDDRTGLHQAYLARVRTADVTTVPTVTGHVANNTYWDWKVNLAGCVIVDAGDTVRVNPRARLTATSDSSGIVVNGMLLFETDHSDVRSRATLRSGSGGRGTWQGITVLPGGRIESGTGFIVADAVQGVSLHDGAKGEIRGVRIENAGATGIWCASDSVQFVSDTVMNVAQGYGMYLYACGPPVESCVFDSCEYGIYAFGSLSTIRGCKVGGPGVKGVMVDGIPDPDTGEAPLFKYCTTYLRSTEIKGYFSSSHLGVGYRGSADIDSCIFETNCGDGRSPYGVRSQWESSRVHMRRSKVLHYGNTGYYSSKSTSDLGTYPYWGGDNQIYTDTTGASIKSVRHSGKTATDTLKAESNWWGTASPPSSWFTSLVDYMPYLTSQPLGKLVPQSAVQPMAVPADFALGQNYPNPFNSSTVIEFALPTPSKAQVTSYNILGQVVKELANREFPAGRHQLIWDGTDTRGRAAPSGIYFYRIVSGKGVESKKMVLLR